jgi:hypothetical protein
MAFTTSKMLNHQVLVTGTDLTGNTGRATLDSTQWDEINERKQFDAATDEFTAAVEAFFAPLQEAVDKVEKAGEKSHDPIGFVVFDEGSEGVAATPRKAVELTTDSIVLRLLESGDTDRLVWVDDSNLGVLEVAVPVSAPANGGFTATPVDEV